MWSPGWELKPGPAQLPAHGLERPARGGPWKGGAVPRRAAPGWFPVKSRHI